MSTSAISSLGSPKPSWAQRKGRTSCSGNLLIIGMFSSRLRVIKWSLILFTVVTMVTVMRRKDWSSNWAELWWIWWPYWRWWWSDDDGDVAAEDDDDYLCVSCLNIAFSWNFGRKASGNPNLGWMSAYLDDKIIHVVQILNQESKVNLNHKIV